MILCGTINNPKYRGLSVDGFYRDCEFRNKQTVKYNTKFLNFLDRYKIIEVSLNDKQQIITYRMGIIEYNI